MSTEARIGVVAGLFIVVVTSVYFFYGQSSQMDDILVSSTGAKVTPPPKIPPTDQAEKKPASPAVTPPTAMADRGASPAQPGGLQSPFVARGTDSPVGAAERIASAQPTGPSGIQPRPTGFVTPEKPVDNSGPRFGNQRGTPPTIGSGSTGESVAAHDELNATSWDRITKPASSESEASVPAGGSGTQTGDVPSLAMGGPDHGTNSKAYPTAGTQDPAKSVAINSARRTEATPTPEKKLPPATGDWPKQHKVVSGDTLIGLAFAYYEDSSRVDAILAANPQIKNPRGLKIGQVVNIPAPIDLSSKIAPPSLASRSESTGLVTLAGRSATTPSNPPAAARPADAVRPIATRIYTVKDGDTFYSIAARVYGDGNKWRSLYEANKSLVKNDPKRLRVGMNLSVPPAESQRP